MADDGSPYTCVCIMIVGRWEIPRNHLGFQSISTDGQPRLAPPEFTAIPSLFRAGRVSILTPMIRPRTIDPCYQIETQEHIKVQVIYGPHSRSRIHSLAR
jgi:hypothetical protein